ncbi:hypothetical protein SFOMI_2997 [Sphingobium fuliginis]|uniref:Uncharacterized protein n=1 Tax=Sphingobium fuliginis (strain ATCC 27551) TaxID=336203 RepID=A0A292ZHV5_SPHSA|nr:hypothetical protein SFOMI_2997 [Sphingobium fuliginis]
MARALPLDIFEPPIPLPNMREMMQHHQAPGLTWLRQRLKKSASMQWEGPPSLP